MAKCITGEQERLRFIQKGSAKQTDWKRIIENWLRFVRYNREKVCSSRYKWTLYIVVKKYSVIHFYNWLNVFKLSQKHIVKEGI